ncbi:MAG: YdcF family protein [Oscillospiraceae bacterium]|jgi:uncharacterized SAM-binding protein YcdF (DUF218 family)|nr:YdcF family protein [Oscillospiraceae bacterium]
MPFILLLVPLVFLALFLWRFHVRRTKLTTAFLFLCFLLTAAVPATLFVRDHLGSLWANLLTLVLGGVLLVVAAFGAYILVGYLLLNTVAIVRHEGRTLQHMLTFLLALGIVVLLLAERFLPNQPLRLLLFVLAGPLAYYTLHLTQFLVGTVLCNVSCPPKRQNYIIILGSGLKKDGGVTPLLAARVDKAIVFYQKQKKKGVPPPKLVCSGGKGSDERRSEAAAMAAYAREQGIPAEHILLEDRSVNTLENMRFSKEIMDADATGQPYRCIYATSNYHVLRAGIFARKAGLHSNGIGGKTAFYFWTNAFLREYIAYLKLYLKWNVTLASVFMLLGGGAFFLIPRWHALVGGLIALVG